MGCRGPDLRDIPREQRQQPRRLPARRDPDRRGSSRRASARRGVPVAAVLLALAAGCSGTTAGESRAASTGENRPAAGAAADNPAAVATTLPEETEDGDPTPLPELPAAPGEECSFLDTMNAIAGSVFQIVLSGPDGPEFGTAFSVGDGDILTAAHLLAGRTSARLRNAVADFPATVIATDPDRDLALLRATEPNGSAGEGLRLRDSAGIQPGEPVASVGYPLFEEYQPSIAGGLVSRLTEDRDLGLLVQTDAPINRGNSGGPLVDRCGRVVGMVVQKWFEEGVEGMGWAVAASSLETALADLRDGRTPASPTTASQTVSTPPPSIPTTSPSIEPTAFLDELAVAWEDFHDRIESAGRELVAGTIDAATLEQVLWQLAEATNDYGNALGSTAYDLSDYGRSCDLARRAYARGLGWTSRLAGFRAAQVRSPGEYRSEVAEAIRKSRAIANEAAEHRDACAGGR